MYPLGQIVEVLTIPIPLQALVKWFVSAAFLERLADPQTARSRMAAPIIVMSSLIHPQRTSSSRIARALDVLGQSTLLRSAGYL